MSIGRKDEAAEPEPRPLHFGLRTLFAWMTALAIITALLAGALGPLPQIVAISVLATLLGWITLSLVFGAPWIALIWLCKQVANLTRTRP
jgi:hypothetical protein